VKRLHLTDDAWFDAWLHDHWRDNPTLTEHAYGRDLIRSQDYLDHTRSDWLRDLNELIVQSAIQTLTTAEALLLIRSRESAPTYLEVQRAAA
jgi:hypothetical protein